jgi:glycosyltransferase involved in cell wall biosynthesis
VSKNLGNPKLSLVMPVYNEEKTVEKAINEVLKHDFINQLVVVNDGSKDKTQEIITSLKDPRLKVIQLPENRGKGFALRTGFINAIGPYVGVQDADMEYNPADLKKLLTPLESGLADAVFGSRFLSGDAHRVLYFWHSLGNKFLTLLSNMNTNLNLTDMETCYKVIHKDILNELDLRENRFGIEPEITAKLSAVGARIYEVGVSYSGRTYQEGKKIGWKDGFRAIFVILKYGNYSRRMRRRYGKLAIQNEDLAPLMGLENLGNLKNYNKWIYQKFSKFISGEVLDIGAGVGNVSKLFIRNSNTLTLLEPSASAFKQLQIDENFNQKKVKLINTEVEDFLNNCNVKFDTITMTNVLEHVKNHQILISQIKNILSVNGKLIIFVPAFELLYSKFDLNIGHFRRYRKKSLTRLLNHSGMKIDYISYFNFFGFFAWFIMARILRGNPTKSKLVKIVDKTLTPILRKIEYVFSPPFGQSLFVVAVPKDKGQ